MNGRLITASKECQVIKEEIYNPTQRQRNSTCISNLTNVILTDGT